MHDMWRELDRLGWLKHVLQDFSPSWGLKELPILTSDDFWSLEILIWMDVAWGKGKVEPHSK